VAASIIFPFVPSLSKEKASFHLNDISFPPWFDELTTSGTRDIHLHPPPRFFMEFILRRFIVEGLRMALGKISVSNFLFST